MTCFKLAIADTAVELLAVQFDENEDVRIWSNGLGPFTDMAQSALQRKRSKKQKAGVMWRFIGFRILVKSAIG
jgi:hypothetical protein